MVQEEIKYILDEDGFFNIGLDDILVIDLYKAIKEKDPNVILKGMSQSELNFLIEDFHKHCETSLKTPTERKIEFYREKYQFLKIMAETLNYHYLEEMTKSLIDSGYELKIGSENNENNVNYLSNLYNKYKSDYDLFLSVQEKSKPLEKIDKNNNIYKSIASLSVASQLKFDSRTMTALEFCGYIQALHEKSLINKNN